MFEDGDVERGNEIYRFTPRIKEGLLISKFATSMMDSSDGIVRSLYEISNLSECGFNIKSEKIPIDDRILDVLEDVDDALGLAMTYGEDFELVFTIPRRNYEEIKKLLEIDVNIIGEVTEGGIKMDGKVLENKGYTHHRIE
jgi:thiamine-monophosphate kinase